MQDSVAKLREELLGQIGSLVKKVDSQQREIDSQREEIGQLTKKGDAQQREIEALTMNDKRLEKRVTELNNCNDELEKKNENLTATVTRMDAHIKDDVESIKKVHFFNLLCTLCSSAFQSSPWH